MTEQIQQRFAGALFLSAFLAYGIGAGLVAPLVESADAMAIILHTRTQLVLGCLLMLCNSAIVIGIGLLLRPTLSRTHATTAQIYVMARLVEGIALAVGAFAFMSLAFSGESISLAHITIARRTNFIGYQTGMLSLGLGSLPFFYQLFRHKLTPAWLALWALIGYAIFATGALLELVGLPYGIMLSVPGGLFELVFGVWLIVKGFHLSA